MTLGARESAYVRQGLRFMELPIVLLTADQRTQFTAMSHSPIVRHQGKQTRWRVGRARGYCRIKNQRME